MPKSRAMATASTVAAMPFHHIVTIKPLLLQNELVHNRTFGNFGCGHGRPGEECTSAAHVHAPSLRDGACISDRLPDCPDNPSGPTLRPDQR